MAAKPIYPTIRDLPDGMLQCMTDAVLNLIYPDLCFVCSAPVARQHDCGICQRCWDASLRLSISPPWCPSCGIPFQNFEQGSIHLCSRCILQPPPYSGARSFGYYTTQLSQMIQEFKFRGRKNLVGLLAPLLAGTFCESWKADEFDILVPMPLHPKRKRSRGFNQAALLAHGLSRLIGVPCSETTLRRVRDTVPQVGLSDPERRNNVRGAFRCTSPAHVDGKRLLLIDDVMTTGASLASASQALLSAGAFRVSALTVARAVPGL